MLRLFYKTLVGQEDSYIQLPRHHAGLYVEINSAVFLFGEDRGMLQIRTVNRPMQIEPEAENVVRIGMKGARWVSPAE